MLVTILNNGDATFDGFFNDMKEIALPRIAGVESVTKYSVRSNDEAIAMGGIAGRVAYNILALLRTKPGFDM